MAEVSGRRPLRPFPALDPEPPRRLTWRSLRWPAVACLAAAAVAAAFLTWPSSSQSASRLARAPFADRDGLVVFEQQPSGMLGTAAPDGSHRVTLPRVGALQGSDLPVAADDGRYLVNLEGQLVTMGPAGPASISDLGASAGLGATELSGGQQQRVAVARALAARPELLIADEPTAEQDAVTRELVLARLLGVAADGGALVLATHDAEVVARCDHVVSLARHLPARATAG